jgi:hypothetical protein
MAAPSEEKLICDKFNLEALTVNQVKSFKALADGKDVFIGTKTGSGIFAYISSITCAHENIFPVCQSFETFHLVDSNCFQIKFITNKFFFTGRCHF